MEGQKLVKHLYNEVEVRNISASKIYVVRDNQFVFDVFYGNIAVNLLVWCEY